MKIETYTSSNQGGRDYNEDTVRCYAQNGVCAAVVADGLGGHGGGQIASSIAADTIVGLFSQNPTLEKGYLQSVFEQANKAVLNKQTVSQKMKSTGVALFVKDNNVMWAHAGDSRLYYFKDGVITAYTLDHSVSQMTVFSGEITREQIRHHSDRNRVLRAFGGDDTIKAEVSPALTLESGSHAFLLCTDGFWEYVFENEMEAELAKAKTPKDWVDGMNRLLASRVPKDHDNFSAAALFFKERKPVGKNIVITVAAILTAIVIAVIALLVIKPWSGGDDLEEDTERTPRKTSSSETTTESETVKEKEDDGGNNNNDGLADGDNAAPENENNADPDNANNAEVNNEGDVNAEANNEGDANNADANNGENEDNADNAEPETTTPKNNLFPWFPFLPRNQN